MRNSLTLDKNDIFKEPRNFRVPIVFLMILGLLSIGFAPAQASSLESSDELGEQLSSEEAESLEEEADLLANLQSSLDPDNLGPRAWEYGEDHYLVVRNLEDNMESMSSASALVDSSGNVVNRFETEMNLITDDFAEITVWTDGQQTAYEAMSLSEAEANAPDSQTSTMSGGYFDRFMDCLQNQFNVPGAVTALITAACTAACMFPPACVACVAGFAAVGGGAAGYCHGQAR